MAKPVEFEKNVNRILHDEHMMVLNLLNRFDAFLKGIGEGRVLNGEEPETVRLLNELITALEQEIDRHFRFEEEALFPELKEAGEDDFAAALQEDHDALRPMAVEIAALARRALSRGLNGEEWRKFRQVGFVYVQDQIAHAEREEAALLPMLEDCLDDEKDIALWSGYADGGSLPQVAE